MIGPVVHDSTVMREPGSLLGCSWAPSVSVCLMMFDGVDDVDDVHGSGTWQTQ